MVFNNSFFSSAVKGYLRDFFNAAGLIEGFR